MNNLSHNENVVINNFISQTKETSEGDFVDLHVDSTDYSIIRQEIVNNILPHLKEIVKEDQASVENQILGFKADDIEQIHLLTCLLNKLENNLRMLKNINIKLSSLNNS